MDLAALIERYRAACERQFRDRFLPSHRRALDAIQHCRRHTSQHTLLAACSGCHERVELPVSCGHRACPRCQHQLTEAWLERQLDKLLPADYFLVTTTLPAELRTLAFNHQRTVYNAMFDVSVSSMQSIARDDPRLQADLGITAVLHTHARDKSYHPHIHMLVPALTVDRKRRIRRKREFLLKHTSIAKVFRPRLLDRLRKDGLIPPKNPDQWVVDVTYVGSGRKALEYLSRYLYRGVIAEHDILDDRDGIVTFRYRHSKTKQWCTQSLPGAEFLWRILRHVLPRRFRRARDYGLLHHSAKALLRRLQLRLAKPAKPTRQTPTNIWQCRSCQAPMRLIARILKAPRARIRDPPEPKALLHPQV